MLFEKGVVCFQCKTDGLKGLIVLRLVEQLNTLKGVISVKLVSYGITTGEDNTVYYIFYESEKSLDISSLLNNNSYIDSIVKLIKEENFVTSYSQGGVVFDTANSLINTFDMLVTKLRIADSHIDTEYSKGRYEMQEEDEVEFGVFQRFDISNFRLLVQYLSDGLSEADIKINYRALRDTCSTVGCCFHIVEKLDLPSSVSLLREVDNFFK